MELQTEFINDDGHSWRARVSVEPLTQQSTPIYLIFYVFNEGDKAVQFGSIDGGKFAVSGEAEEVRLREQLLMILARD